MGSEGATAGSGVDHGINEWNGVSGSDYVLSRVSANTAGFTVDGVNTMVWAAGNGCVYPCLALTSQTLVTGQVIIESDITFNTSENWTTSNSNFDIRAVATHELGHSRSRLDRAIAWLLRYPDDELRAAIGTEALDPRVQNARFGAAIRERLRQHHTNTGQAGAGDQQHDVHHQQETDRAAGHQADARLVVLDFLLPQVRIGLLGSDPLGSKSSHVDQLHGFNALDDIIASFQLCL